MEKVRTFIYIDGFNFYYGSLKDTPHKWLDFKKFFESVLDLKHSILSIKYFTALVSSPPNDPQKTTRQQVYLRALKTYIPEIEVYQNVPEYPPSFAGGMNGLPSPLGGEG